MCVLYCRLFSMPGCTSTSNDKTKIPALLQFTVSTKSQMAELLGACKKEYLILYMQLLS